MKSSLKGGIAGAIGTVVLLAAGTAVAGTGVGGVFNLGQTNTVDATTTLSGNTNSAQLRLSNTSTGSLASALNLNVGTGRPPFVTNSGTKVTNLNVDKVDGLSSNEISRLAAASTNNTFWLEDSRTVLQTVTITAPLQGFVFLSGSVAVQYTSGCAFCAVHLRFRDVEASNDTVSNAGVVHGASEQIVPLALSLAIPVSAGTHNFQLIGSWYDVNQTNVTPTGWFNASATAIFMRFNGVGTSALSGPASTSSSPSRNTRPHSATQR